MVCILQDVHEIEMGSDWQDSLNNAIQSCNFFVPLITPMYGRTQWTNREVSALCAMPSSKTQRC